MVVERVRSEIERESHNFTAQGIRHGADTGGNARVRVDDE